jgi:hypothetical protein
MSHGTLTASAAPVVPSTSVVETGSSALARRDDRTRRAAWLLGAAVLSLAFTVQPFRDPDVWWHLAAGRLITDHGIPSSEPFTFLGAPHQWIGQQWGYEVLLARLVDAGGAGLAMLVMGAVAAGALLVAALALPRHAAVPSWARAAAMVVSGLVFAQLVGVRGQVISLLGSALVLLIVARWRDGSTRASWLLVPLIAIWANLHAGFVVGLGIPVIVATSVVVWRRVDRGSAPSASVRALLLATGVAVAAVMLNPAGPHLYSYVADTFANPTLTQGIVEWQSPSFHNTFLRLFEVEVVALLALWALSRRPDPVDVVLGVGAVLISLQAQRNVAVFAVVAVPQLARYGAMCWDRLGGGRGFARPRRPAPTGFLVMLAAMVGALTVIVDVVPATRASATADYEAEHYPRAAADYVASHLQGQRLYSTYEWGGYLAYRFPNSRVVYIYGESAIFGSDRLNEYLQVHTLQPGWPDVLFRDGMNHAVVPASSQETTALLELGWQALCYDNRGGAVVLGAPQTPGAVSPASLPPDVTQASSC